MNTLMGHPVPGVVLRVFECRFSPDTPLLEQDRRAVLPTEVRRQSLLEAPAEEQGSLGFLFLPAVQIAIAIATRAAEVLADLRIAISHCPPPPRLLLAWT